MSDPEVVQANMRKAMEVITAWATGGDDDSALVTAAVLRFVLEALESGDEIKPMLELVQGLTNVAGRLLVRLEAATATPMAEIVRDLGQRIAEGR